jgi:serine O-acetyltransferase
MQYSIPKVDDMLTVYAPKSRDVACRAEARVNVQLPPLPRGDKNLNPPGIGFLSLVREDLGTHDNNPFEPGFWAVALHRFGNWRMGIRPRVIRLPFSLTYKFLSWSAELVSGINLPYTVRLGRRVRIWHHGGIVVQARSIGNDVHLRHNTTIGLASRSRPLEIPTIEDAVDIGCGACLLGNINVGRNSVVGANAVVVKNVPPYATVVGNPARILKRFPHDECQRFDSVDA